MPRIRPTEEFQDLLHAVLGSSKFSSALSDRRWIVRDMDEVPPEDEKGFRKIDGWSMTLNVTVEENWVSNHGNMHGAAYAWVIDDATSAALIPLQTPTFWGAPLWTGVSVSMNIEYFHPATVGTELAVEVEVVKCSQRLAHLTCEIKDRHTGKRYAKGSQWKAWKPPAEVGNRAKL